MNHQHRPGALDIRPSSSSSSSLSLALSSVPSFSASASSSSASSASYSSTSAMLNPALLSRHDDFHLDFLEERAMRGNNRESYDEIDLVSECSTPSAYTPGKYLQLCDIDPSDANEITLWPPSASLLVQDDNSSWDTPALGLPLEKPYVHPSPPSYTSYNSPFISDRQCRHSRCLSNRIVVLIAVCLIIALGALGGLVVVI